MDCKYSQCEIDVGEDPLVFLEATSSLTPEVNTRIGFCSSLHRDEWVRENGLTDLMDDDGDFA